MSNHTYETYYIKKKKPIWKTLMKWLFSHVGLFCLVCVYAVIGAYAFIALELPSEEQRYELKKLKSHDVEDAKKYLSELFLHYHTKNFTKAEWDDKVLKDLEDLKNFVLESKSMYSYDGNIEGWDWSWTFPKSLLFTISIMTLIGYGHIYPVTHLGQIFCILYSMVGIPLLLIFLANIGDSMANFFRYLYSRWCCRWCRSRRKDSEHVFGTSRKGKRLIDEKVGMEDYMPSDQVVIPIVLNLVIIAVYLVMGAAMFSVWEEWDLASSVYFTFVTLTTVGFGDYVPGNSLLDFGDSTMAAIKMLVAIIYCVFGLALVSMCISLMQEQIMDKCRWFAMVTGLASDPDTDESPVEPLEQKPVEEGEKKDAVDEKKEEEAPKEEEKAAEPEPEEKPASRPASGVSRPGTAASLSAQKPDVLPGTPDVPEAAEAEVAA